jgi:hypothetical protein
LSPTAIVELAKQHGLSSVALTDTGNLHGAVEFVEAAKKAGVKPILGAEVRVGDQLPCECPMARRSRRNTLAGDHSGSTGMDTGGACGANSFVAWTILPPTMVSTDSMPLIFLLGTEK